MGRWISRDPAGEYGGFHLYGFVQNHPTNNIDPSGLEELEGIWALSRGLSSNKESWDDSYYANFYEPRDATRDNGQEFVDRFKLFLSPLEGLLKSGIDTIKGEFSGFKDRAKSKVSFAHDIRIPGVNIGIFKTKFGGVLKVASDGCCVKVSGGPTFAAVAKGPSTITLAGGVSVTGGVYYKYCWTDKTEKWSGSIGGTGFIELRVGIDVWVAAAYAAGGVYVNYKYDFATNEGKFGIGGHLRAVFEADLGVWTKRRQYKYTIGDPDVHF